MDFRRIIPTRLGQVAVGTSDTDLYTCGANVKGMLKTLDIFNTSSGLVKINVYLLPNGDSTGTANALFYEYPIMPNTPIQWTGTQILTTGDKIVCKADAIGVTVTASGAEVM